jgi:hypothetical protein
MLAGTAGGLVAVGFELAFNLRPSAQEVRLLERAAEISSASLPTARPAPRSSPQARGTAADNLHPNNAAYEAMGSIDLGALKGNK